MVDELENDDAVTQLIDSLYAKMFTGSYAISGGGTVEAAGDLTAAKLQPYLNWYKTAPGAWFWAGSSDAPATSSIDVAATRALEAPKYAPEEATHYVEDDANGLLSLDTGYSFDELMTVKEYLRIRFGSQVFVYVHVLPKAIVAAASFDLPNLTRGDVTSAISDFDNLDDAQMKHLRQLATASVKVDLSSPEGATRLAKEGLDE